MAADFMEITIEGQPQLAKLIEAITHGLNLEKALDESAAAMFNRQQIRFLQGVSPDEQPWKISLAAQRRYQQGRGGGTLYDTGLLFHSIQLFSQGEDERAIGTDVPYGKFHQYGTIHLPVRQFLGFGDADVQVAEDIVLHRVIEALQ